MAGSFIPSRKAPSRREIAMENQTDAIIIGGGVAGLSCARTLVDAGKTVHLYEADDAVGGRIRTDLVDGFRLDRGFQVLLTAYPEAKRLLDYSALRLRPFYPGALIRFQNKWHRVADPLRQPLSGIASLFTPIGSLGDKLRMGRLRVLGTQRYQFGPDQDTLSALRAEGFSHSMIERFLRPFLGGVFLENELETTARKFASVWRYFSAGDTAVPALGMGEIPRQLAASLPEPTLRLGTPVAALELGGIRLENGERPRARAVVVATDAAQAARLLETKGDPPQFNSVRCLYFSADSAPIPDPLLILNGDGAGPINNLSVMSAVSPDYAPEGKALISATLLDSGGRDQAALEQQTRTQLASWFGAQVNDWRLLRNYHIPNATPHQTRPPSEHPRVRPGVYRCGDHCGLASLDSALVSGRAAAESLLSDPI